MGTTSLLQSRAEQALRHSPIPALRKLRVEQTDDKVVIAGSVSSYYFKQLAQETLMPLLDGRALCNHVAVVGTNGSLTR